MASTDSQGSRNVIWPPPAADKSQEWQQQHQHYGQSYGQQQSQTKLKLTPEEMAVLKSCSRDSFWFRCVPLAFGAIVATQTLTNRGILKPHPRFGSLFKNMAAGLIAYFVGKVSYQGECRRKIMMLENSPLADAMRKGKRGRELFQEMAILSPNVSGDSSPSASDPRNPKITGESSGSSHLDIDTDSTKYTELDDGQRPTLDSTERKPRQDSLSQSYTNYADLRTQNRMEYERKVTSNSAPSSQTRPSNIYSERPLPPPPPSSDMYSSGLGMGSSKERSNEPLKAPRRNKYGDLIDD